MINSTITKISNLVRKIVLLVMSLASRVNLWAFRLLHSPDGSASAYYRIEGIIQMIIRSWRSGGLTAVLMNHFPWFMR